MMAEAGSTNSGGKMAEARGVYKITRRFYDQ